MNIETFVLIGGRSSRFGRDKFCADFKGQTLVGRMANIVREAFPGSEVSMVAASADQVKGLDISAPVVFDAYADRGPWSGLHAALTNATSEWILALACDYPMITSQLLQRLDGMTSDDIDAIVPVQSDGNLQPLCALYRLEPCRDAVLEFLDNDKKTPPLRAIFDKVRTLKVAFDELKDLAGAEHFFVNVNTPDDLDKAIAILGAHPSFVAK